MSTAMRISPCHLFATSRGQSLLRPLPAWPSTWQSACERDESPRGASLLFAAMTPVSFPADISGTAGQLQFSVPVECDPSNQHTMEAFQRRADSGCETPATGDTTSIAARSAVVGAMETSFNECDEPIDPASRNEISRADLLRMRGHNKHCPGVTEF